MLFRSAIIDPQGRVEQHTDLFESTVVTARVPIRTGETPYVRYGALILPASIAVLLTAGAVAWRRRRLRAAEHEVDEGAEHGG